MEVAPYEWASIGEFVNRAEELARMETWWEATTRQPLAILGRRRVGKSWLFRRFAHHKPAVVLVAEQLPVATQLERFAAALEPVIGFRPALSGIGDLIKVLYRAAKETELLVIIDEFPYLLGSSAAEVAESSSAVQAAMESERDGSRLKLVVCGSQVSQMQAMFGEHNPLHGRLERLEVRPLSYNEAARMLTALTDTIERFERYCISGGMPMYLGRLGNGPLRAAVCMHVLDRFAPLWNEGRVLVEQELREPRVYLAILERLAAGPQEVNELAQHAGLDSKRVSKYLSVLKELRLVSRSVPIGAGPDSRAGRWQLDDPFLRFWFRFVFVHQADLEGGLDASGLFDSLVAPDIADHCAPVFEQWAHAWLRTNRAATAINWGRWWGNAANIYRRDKTRTTEEIDVVGLLRNRVTAVVECKWTSKQLTPSIVTDLDTYKIPALRDSGLKVAKNPRMILMCRSGYSESLEELAATDERIELVDVPTALSTWE
jgi:AAA+ ATPase superfamily predicted ATPase